MIEDQPAVMDRLGNEYTFQRCCSLRDLHTILRAQTAENHGRLSGLHFFTAFTEGVLPRLSASCAASRSYMQCLRVLPLETLVQ
jgi:hypothetical protein